MPVAGFSLATGAGVRLVALVLSGLVLAGCNSDQADQGDYTPEIDPVERARCEARGGEYAPAGLLGMMACYEATPDAGKVCSRAGDCVGICYADTRQCSEVTPIIGCFSYLDEKGERVEICMD